MVGLEIGSFTRYMWGAQKQIPPCSICEELREGAKNIPRGGVCNILSFHGNFPLKSTMMHFVTLTLLYIAL